MVKKRTNQPRLSADLVRNIGLGIIVVITLFFMARGVASFIDRSPMFLVRNLVIVDGLGELDIPEFAKLKGRNIFSVDLDKFETKIRGRYPALSSLRVTRRLPDQLVVSAVKRDPFARAVLNGRTMVIDRNGYVVSSSTEDTVALTLIKGLRAAKAAPGDAVSGPQATTAIGIISRFRSDRTLAVVPLRTVDVSDSGRIVCVVGEEDRSVEVFFDNRSFTSRAGELGVLFSHGDVDTDKISYIDLRFDAPIIGQKKAKKT